MNFRTSDNSKAISQISFVWPTPSRALCTLMTKSFMFTITAALIGVAMPVSHAAAQGKSSELVIGLPANVNTLDPHQTVTVETDLSVISNIYQSLVVRTPDMKVVPGIAKSWRPLNPTTWQFELFPGQVFANGEKLDAQAIKWNFERVLDPKTASRIKSWFDPVSEIKVLSATSLQIVTKEPYPALVDQLTMFFVLPPKWASENNPSRASNGSGPYVLKEFVSGDRIVLERNSAYKGADKPGFTRVTFKPIPEAAARVAAVMAGEIDFASQVSPNELTRVTATGKARGAWLAGTRSMFLKFNTKKAPLKDNVLLRQAINLAIDKQAIIKSVLGGAATPSTCQVTTPAYFGYNTTLQAYAYDPERAKQLMVKAGYNRNQVIELEVPLGRYLQAQEVSQAIAAQLEEVGFKIKLVELEFGNWLNKYRKLGNLGQTAYMGQGWPTLDADGLLTLFESSNEYAFWDNKEFDSALRDARSSVDPVKRNALYKQATDVMCKDAPVAFLWSQPFTYALSNRIEWRARGDEWLRATDFKTR